MTGEMIISAKPLQREQQPETQYGERGEPSVRRRASGPACRPLILACDDLSAKCLSLLAAHVCSSVNLVQPGERTPQCATSLWSRLAGPPG